MFLSFFCFFCFFFILRDGIFFDEKYLKMATRRYNRASSAKSPLFREKKRQMMMAKYVAFSLLFFSFDENTYIPKKKTKTIISSISPHHRSNDEGVWRCRTDTLSVSHAVVQMDHMLSYRWITSCRTTWRRI